MGSKVRGKGEKNLRRASEGKRGMSNIAKFESVRYYKRGKETREEL